MAGCKQREGIAVAAVAEEPHLLLQCLEALLELARVEVRGCREQNGIRKRMAGPRGEHPLSVRSPIERLLAVGEKTLAGEGLVHQPHDGLAVPVEADQRAPHRQAGDECTGPVDRVDDPDEFAVETDIAVLFAENAVFRKAALNQRADRRLSRPVGFRHRVEAAFELVENTRANPEARHGFGLGGVGETVEESTVGQHVALCEGGGSI